MSVCVKKSLNVLWMFPVFPVTVCQFLVITGWWIFWTHYKCHLYVRVSQGFWNHYINKCHLYVWVSQGFLSFSIWVTHVSQNVTEYMSAHVFKSLNTWMFPLFQVTVCMCQFHVVTGLMDILDCGAVSCLRHGHILDEMNLLQRTLT